MQGSFSDKTRDTPSASLLEVVLWSTPVTHAVALLDDPTAQGIISGFIHLHGFSVTLMKKLRSSQKLHISKVSEIYVLNMLRVCGFNNKHPCCKNTTWNCLTWHGFCCNLTSKEMRIFLQGIDPLCSEPLPSIHWWAQMTKRLDFKNKQQKSSVHFLPTCICVLNWEGECFFKQEDLIQ